MWFVVWGVGFGVSGLGVWVWRVRGGFGVRVLGIGVGFFCPPKLITSDHPCDRVCGLRFRSMGPGSRIDG